MGTSCYKNEVISLYRSRATCMPPQIILLPVDKSSCTETLWMPVMVTCTVLEALHYYAFCTIFYGYPRTRPVSSGRDGFVAVVWPHTTHPSPGILVFVSNLTTTCTTDSVPPRAKACDVLLFLDIAVYYNLWLHRQRSIGVGTCWKQGGHRK